MARYSSGGMCEWLKQAVLKTAVRETVPGVRIPLPPPDSLNSREFAPSFLSKLATSGPFFAIPARQSGLQRAGFLSVGPHSSGLLCRHDKQSDFDDFPRR